MAQQSGGGGPPSTSAGFKNEEKPREKTEEQNKKKNKKANKHNKHKQQKLQITKCSFFCAFQMYSEAFWPIATLYHITLQPIKIV